MRTWICGAAVFILAIAIAAPAAADAPTRTTSVLSFGPFIDEETCAFPLSVSVERTRTTTTFANGDVKRHVQLLVTTSANGNTLVESDSYNVFVDHANLTLWVITGRFGQFRVDGGGPVVVQSGRILYDLATDTLLDPHPHGQTPDPCTALAA